MPLYAGSLIVTKVPQGGGGGMLLIGEAMHMWGHTHRVSRSPVQICYKTALKN